MPIEGYFSNNSYKIGPFIFLLKGTFLLLMIIIALSEKRIKIP